MLKVEDLRVARALRSMAEAIEQNMDKFSAAEALDNQCAYYKVC
jgi:hypothetical protein